uniref:cytochrome c oxidase subunit III n=1 Tax=Docophoroides brevis TaxID=160119 RepID=UPI00211E10BE|nr:cytochrome c oxidase subunit III [Docophoroides brevis]UTT72583.1 cytochrome c oxidase subunit 3 [Docophoroides brevis]
MVDLSPWPLVGSFSIMSYVMNMYLYMKGDGYESLIISLMSLMMMSYQWWRDVVRESLMQGMHPSNVTKGIYLGVSMFILSEVMFFFSFFFGFFFTALNPDIELGQCWPPTGIQSLSYMHVPVLNTILLLSSGISITWAHHSLLESNINQCKISLIITILLGMVFSAFQFIEYYECPFSMADSVYGSLFFITTGFHGIHVIIGTSFIFVMLMRLSNLHMSSSHHVGFEASAWYWHFVDVVWLFLFVSIYWWGS